MLVEQRRWNHGSGWTVVSRSRAIPDAQLVLVFGKPNVLQQGAADKVLRRYYPEAQLRRCEATGDVMGTHLAEGDIVAIAVRVELADVLGHCGTPTFWEAAVA